MSRSCRLAPAGAGIAIGLRVPIRSATDIVMARQAGRELALKLGFVGGEVTVIAAAMSEMTGTNVHLAQRGRLVFATAQQREKAGPSQAAQDDLPGILD